MWMELGKIWKIYKGNVRGPGMVVRNSFGEFIAARTCFFLGGAESASVVCGGVGLESSNGFLRWD